MKINEFVTKLRSDKRTLLILVFMVLLVAFLAIKVSKASEKEETMSDKELTMVEIPDAEKTQMQDSKINSYKSNDKNWERYENAMQDDDDPYQDSSKPKDNQAPTQSEDDVVKNLKSDDASSKSSRSSGGSRSGGSTSNRENYREQRMREYYENTEQFVASEKKESENEKVDSTSDEPSGDPATTIGEAVSVRKSSAMSTLEGNNSGFSSLADDDTVSTDEEYPFECMFVREEKLHNGSRVSVRLLEDMVVGGVLIPKNTHLMATCNINNRLELTVTSIEMNSKIYALGYEAYDNDGSKGIYCPDLNAQARKTAKSQGLSTIGSLIGGRVGRLASTAVTTGVSIAQSKSGEVTVTVPSGYRFFIVKSKR